MSRAKHPVKELEAILREAELRGWTADKGKKYYMIKCPCGNHQKTIKLTPSDPNYERNLLGQPRRATCWDKEEEQR